MTDPALNKDCAINSAYIADQADISFGYTQEALKTDHPERRLHFLKLAALTHPGGTGCRGEIVSVADYDEGREFALRFPTPDYPAFELASGQTMAALGYDYLRLDGAAVTARGHICHSGRLMSDVVQSESPFWRDGDVHYWFYVDRPFAGFDPATRRAFMTLPKAHRPRQAFVFPTANASVNFGHFLHDLLIRVPIYRRLRAMYGEITCLFAERFRYSMQWVLFDEIFRDEIAAGLVTFEDIAATYDTVFVAFSQFSPLDSINYDAANEVRSLLQAIAASKRSDKPYGSRLYVSRKDGTSKAYGRAENGDEEASLFEELGFEVLTISQMAPEDVFAAFYGADIVAGIHGAGLLNALFSANRRCKLIEICPPDPCWNSIERMTKAAGLEHSSIASRPKREDVLATIETLVAAKR